MEYTASQKVATNDQAWKAYREEAHACESFDVQSLVDRVLESWRSTNIGFKAVAYAKLDRPTNLSIARSLREAEQAIFAVVSAAIPLFQEGHLSRMNDLMFALLRCRMWIVLPVAKRMADRDEAGRSAEDIALLLAEKAQFVDGRAIIDQALASEFPSPYKPEEANA